MSAYLVVVDGKLMETFGKLFSTLVHISIGNLRMVSLKISHQDRALEGDK